MLCVLRVVSCMCGLLCECGLNVWCVLCECMCCVLCVVYVVFKCDVCVVYVMWCVGVCGVSKTSKKKTNTKIYFS